MLIYGMNKVFRGISLTIATLAAAFVFGCFNSDTYEKQIKEAQAKQDLITKSLVGRTYAMGDEAQEKKIKRVVELYLGFEVLDPLEYDDSIVEFTENLVSGAKSLDEEVERIYFFFQDHEDYRLFLCGKEVIHDYIERKKRNPKAKPRGDCWSLTLAEMICVRLRKGEVYCAEPKKYIGGELFSEAIDRGEVEGRHIFGVGRYDGKYMPLDVRGVLGIIDYSEVKVVSDVELFAEAHFLKIVKKKITGALDVEKLLKQAIALNPFNGLYRCVYATTFIDKPESVGAAEEAFRLDPGDFRFSYCAALAYNRWAEQNLERKDDDVIVRPATQDEALRNYQKARFFAETSLRLFPGFNKGIVLLDEIEQKVVQLARNN